MSIETTLARVGAIRQALADPAALVGSSGGTEAPAARSPASAFAAALTQASAGYPQPTSATLPSGAYPGAVAGLQGSGAVYGSAGAQGLGPALSGAGNGARIVAAAESQIGQSEQPPGSNESPAIAEYRGASAGAIPGAPWCAYFTSWAARQAGEPIGAGGQGLGSVSEIWSWAQGAGRAMPNGPGVVPQPGDLIVFGSEHVGIVKGVLADGRIQTIEGNYQNKVSANVRSAGEASGYVRMA
jgi:CHAP domain